MATFLNDTFTGAQGTLLSAHTGETGATWTQYANLTAGTVVLTNVNSAKSGTAAQNTAYVSSGTPAGADYDVIANFIANTNSQGGMGVGARWVAGGGYFAWHNPNTTVWEIYKVVTAAVTILGSSTSDSLQPGTAFLMKFQLRGTTLKLLVSTDGGANWVQKISLTDATYAAAGKAAVYAYQTGTDAQGYQFDQIQAVDALTQSQVLSQTHGQINKTYTITTTGTGTSWVNGTTTFSSTGGTGASVSVVSIAGQVATLTVVTGSTPGILTISNSLDASQVQFTVGVTVAVNDANAFPSPYTWFFSGSTYMQATSRGAYVKLGFTGSTVQVVFDCSPEVTAAIAAGNYPTVGYWIDDGPLATFQLTSATSTLPVVFGSGLYPGNHRLYLYIKTHVDTMDLWTAPAEVVRITAFLLDSVSASTAAWTLQAKRMIGYGDSIWSGTASESAAASDGYHSSMAGLAQAMNCEYGQVAYDGQAVCQAGFGNTAAFFVVGNDASSAWNKHWAGVSRLSGGLYTPAPDHIVINHGRNDSVYSIAAGTFQAAVAACLTAMRVAAPAAWIWWVVPFSGLYLANLQAAFVTYQAATPDPRCVLINLGAVAAAGLDVLNGPNPALNSYDNVHPNAYVNGRLGAMMAAQINAYMQEFHRVGLTGGING